MSAVHAMESSGMKEIREVCWKGRKYRKFGKGWSGKGL